MKNADGGEKSLWETPKFVTAVLLHLRRAKDMSEVSDACGFRKGLFPCSLLARMQIGMMLSNSLPQV